MQKKHYKKRKINKIRLTILLSILFLLGIFIYQKRDNISFTEGIIKDIILFPLTITSKIVPDKDVTYNNSNELLTAQNIELKKEIDELKNTVQLDNMLSDYVIVRANVIKRDLTYFFDTITINKGTLSGIDNNMAVVAGSILIGKTKNVSLYHSEVELLTSESINKISVKIDNSNNTFIYGLLAGYSKDNNIYYVEGISKTTEVNMDSLVTTTGLGDVFPSGILIGKVTGVTTDHFDLSKKVEVTPLLNINDFTVVSVLKRNVDL